MARVLVKDATTELSTNIGIVTIPGEIKSYAGTSAPTGFLFCHGQAVSRTTYSALFSVLGTSHGQGDGSTTFNLPDYRGQFLRGRVNVTTVSGSGSASSNNATFTAHGFNRTGFKVRLSSGTLSGLSTSTDYYAIVVDSNTLAFATSLANAISGTKVVISGVNSAVIVQYEDPDYSSRVAVTVGGSTGNSVGSIQADEFKSHNHSITTANGGGSPTNARVGPSDTSAGQITATGAILVNGGNESRPKNSLINYIIKY